MSHVRLDGGDGLADPCGVPVPPASGPFRGGGAARGTGPEIDVGAVGLGRPGGGVVSGGAAPGV